MTVVKLGIYGTSILLPWTGPVTQHFGWRWFNNNEELAMAIHEGL